MLMTWLQEVLPDLDPGRFVSGPDTSYRDKMLRLAVEREDPR